MADGGQRLLDVIDDVFSSDPNALESFLGGLTSASDLLPSAESVDTVVASLAQSLGADYEVDSPNDTLFDTLEASSTNLTDISQSYVPSDFENASVYGSGNNLSQHLDHQHLTPTSTAGQNQSFETQTGTINGGTSTDINVEVLVNSTLQQQYPNSVCDSTSSFTNPPQQQQQQLQQQQPIQNMAPSDSFNQNYSQLVDIHTQQQNVSQTPSLSSSSNSSSNVNTNSCNNNGNNNECLQVAVSTHTATNPSNLISSVPTIASISSSKSNVSGNIVNTVSNLVTTAAGLVSKFSLQQQPEKEMSVSAQNQNICGVIGNAINSVPQLSSSISSSSPANINLQIQQQAQSQPQQQFIVSAAAQNINQLVQQQGQAVSFSSMTMGPQLMSSNTNGGLISSVISGGQGANLMHIQSAAGQPQQFLTIEHPTPTLIATGGTTFGAGNLTLVSTGGTPTYAVLPTGPQLFSNAIVQPQLQALKNSGQTFFQTASGSIVAANSIHSIQGVQNVVPSIRAKQQPQILPKPALNSAVISNLNPTSSSTNITTNSWNTSVSSTSESNGTGTVVVASPSTVGEQQQQQQPQHIGVSMANMGQLLQQQTQHLHQVPTNSIVTSVANGSVRFSQPSFTIGGAGGIGQVMVSGIGNINTTMSSPQAQLAGTTIVLNQFGQPVLLPTGGASQNNGLQLILRQQPAQPQVLTIQAPAGTTALGAPAAQATASSCKPIVRYVPQMPQNQTVQIQQIQTPNGPAYIAVRCPSNAQPQTAQFVSSQIQQEPAPPTPVQPAPQPVQPSQASVTVTPGPGPGPVHNPINTLQQQTLGSITQHSQQQITIKAEKVERPQSYKQKQTKSSAIPDSSSSESPTPKKKPSKKKKKVTLDLDEILKQSGIGDEDLQDDSCFENTIPSHTPVPAEGTNGFQTQAHTPTTSPAVKPNGSLNKSKNLPVNILPPHVHVLKPTTNPPNNKNQRNNSSNSREGAGSSNSTKKSPAKKAPPKRKAPPLKKQEPPAKQPALSPSPAQNKKNSPKSNNSRKKPNTNANAPATKKNASPSKSPASKGNASKTSAAASTHVPATAVTQSASVNSTTMSNSSSTSSGPPNASSVGVSPASNNTSTQRIVHTIQLTPQNQQLLRNIQAQITRLVALPKRNENEQTALQKLIYLQQQVIATGTPVPNPASLNNLNNNMLTMPGGTTPSTTTSTVPQLPPLTSSSPVVNFSSNNNFITTQTTVAQSPSINSVLSPSLTSTTCTSAAATIDNTKINQSSSVSTTALIGQFNQANVGYAIQLSPDSTTQTSTTTTAHYNILSKEKTDVTNNLPTNDGVDKVNNSTNSTPSYNSGSTVLLVEDSKIIEQRRAAAKAEEEARARWRKEQFDFLLKRDQDFFVEPDYKTPFTSKQDAVERLMKYHLARDKTEMDFEDFDEEFSDTAVRLLEKFSCMVAKYKSLMLKESMRQVSCAERVMVERTFCNEEKVKLEQDKLLVAQGEILELPPPPSSWAPKLRELVEADLKEIELDSVVNEQVQSAIDSIISCGNNDTPSYLVPEEGEKIEYDAFGVPTSSSSNYGGMNSSSADIDEAVRSILA